MLKPHCNVFQIEDTITAFNLLEKIGLFSVPHHEREVSIIVDLNMEGWKGYNFLDTLNKKMLPCPIKVYTIKNVSKEDYKLSLLVESFVSGELEKPFGLNEIEETLLPKAEVIYHHETG